MVEASPPVAQDGAVAFTSHRTDSLTNHQTSHRATKESIALEMHASYVEVDRVYEQELENLAQEAKITQFLDVIVYRRVRMRLRQRQQQ